MMLHTKQSSRSRLLKLLALLPIVGIALAVNAEKVVDVRYEEPQKKMVKGVAEKKAETPETFTATMKYDTIPGETFTAVGTFEPVQGDVFDVVEEMPQYPGGPQALFKFLGENVHYPAEAEKAGIQGRVIATFVVEKDGSICESKVVKSVDPSLDAEALRVINAMPNWKPGKQNGKEVRVKYTVPVAFMLQGKDANVAQHESSSKDDGEVKKKLSELVVVAYGPNKEAKPLVYVDGKEIPFEDINKVDPKTIDHMNIVKDKVAIEKYGEKAKDGVILITTKK